MLIARTKVDPDLWGHVRFGGDILRNGLARNDPYSFTSDIPWVNHEWLAEVLLWIAWSAGGGFGLIILKIVLVGTMLTFAWAVLKPYALPLAASEALFFVLVLGTWARTSVVRPQLFSLALFAGLLWVLQSVDRGHPRRLWLVPTIFLLWINLHGGWIVGFGMFGLYCGAALLTSSGRAQMPGLAAAAALSALALLANPYGIHMIDFIATTVRLDRSDIVDWQPMWGDPLLVGLWICSAALAGFVLLRRWRTVAPWQFAIVVTLGLASLRVSRLDAFFAIAAAMLLGPHLGETRARLSVRRRHPAPLIAGAVTAAGIVVGSAVQQPVTCIGLDLPWAPERQAGTFIAANKLRGRLLTWFDWGQYVIWHFGPELAVSVDGRRETVYSAAFLRMHDQLYAHADENATMLASMDADYAWLPARMPLVKTLDAQGWVRIFTGEKSVVFARHPGTFVNAPAPTGFGCFPGP
jgi:hypothetical protein